MLAVKKIGQIGEEEKERNGINICWATIISQAFSERKMEGQGID